ncbi:MAG TPA: glycerol-3-phosphate dehydrogenase/oxidase [Candidatus Methylacidiphilales bacterium]
MNRNLLLQRLDDTRIWDVVIVGGGATGLGAAVDAAARGYRTLLLEQADFAKATSSRSTKLSHGGVRYLQQGNLSLVFGALHERGLMIRNAPHLVHPLNFIIPAYRWWEKAYYGVGLECYELMAGRLSLGRSHVLSREAALKALPTVRADGLRGGVSYHDGQFDDARLAVALLRTFVDLGGTALNYFSVTGFIKEGGKVAGVHARDGETGERHEIRARAVLNATGVFTDSVRRLDEPDAGEMLSVSQGAHFVLDRSFFPGTDALMIPKTEDGRVLFAVPWNGHVVVGTTDVPTHRASLEPRATDEEKEFLLHHANLYLDRKVTPQDVKSVFCGLRPLVKASGAKNTAQLSRDHTIVVSPSGLVTITGGKWTTYRHMGEDAIDHVVKVAGIPHVPSPTRELRLRGWSEAPHARVEGGNAYGSDAPAVAALAASEAGLAALIHPSLPYQQAEVLWAARHEMARTVEDVLARRTRSLLLDARASIEAAPGVARLLARELGRDAAWEKAQADAYRDLASGYLMN